MGMGHAVYHTEDPGRPFFVACVSGWQTAFRTDDGASFESH